MDGSAFFSIFVFAGVPAAHPPSLDVHVDFDRRLVGGRGLCPGFRDLFGGRCTLAGAGRGAVGVLCHDDSFRRNYPGVSGCTGHSGTHWAPGNAGDLLFFDADIYFAWLWLRLLSERRRAHLVHGLLVLLGYRRCELCNLHIMGSRAISDGVSGQRLRFFHFRRAFCGSGHYVFGGRGRSPFPDDWHPSGSDRCGVCDRPVADSIWRRNKGESAAGIEQSPPLQCEISSRASPRVFGPQIPIDSMTTSIEAAMKAKTPATPKSRKKKPIRKLVKMALNRLHEYTKPTA